MKIKTFSSDQQGQEFYGIMGEHFASLEHKKELGGWQLYNMPNSTWFLMFDDDEQTLIGFCVFFKKNDHHYLDNFMILKKYRRNGYSNILMGECLKQFDGIKIKAMTNNPIQMKVFEKSGFILSFMRGSYGVYFKNECV
jgi:RimJ/RimL family protein N-acetyltransferase